MKRLTVGDVYEEAWLFTKKYGVMMCIILLVIYIISYSLTMIIPGPGMQDIIEAQKNNDPEAVLAIYKKMAPQSIVSGIISSIIMMGLLNTTLRLVKGEQDSVDFSGFRMPAEQYVKCVCSYIVVAFIVGIGYVCCILPGIFLLVRLMYVPMTYLDDPQLSFLDGFKRSWQMTSNNFMSLLLIGIVSVLVSIVGLACCCIGIIPATVIIMFAYVVTFLIIKGDDQVTPSQSEGVYHK